MTEEDKVNGTDRHRLYAELTEVADAEGNAGDIQWNFEKNFSSLQARRRITRFRPATEPGSPEVVTAIEGAAAG